MLEGHLVGAIWGQKGGIERGYLGDMGLLWGHYGYLRSLGGM